MTKKYWNKRRRYGYGWTPTTWKGWLLAITFIAAALVPALFVVSNESLIIWYFVYLAVLLTVFLIVITQVSPQAKWRWGKKPSDNKKEDF
jgi:uncharacterized membrane protein YhaH (DUF805 family)